MKENAGSVGCGGGGAKGFISEGPSNSSRIGSEPLLARPFPAEQLEGEDVYRKTGRPQSEKNHEVEVRRERREPRPHLESRVLELNSVRCTDDFLETGAFGIYRESKTPG